MEFFKNLMDLSQKLPEFVSLYVCPIVLFAVGFVLAVTHHKKAFLPLAVAFGGIGMFLAASQARDSSVVFAWAGLYLAVAVLTNLLFQFSFRPKKKQHEGTEEMYQKFHMDLDVPEESGFSGDDCKISMEESGVRLNYVQSLLAKLNNCNLTPSDRLEADAISRTLSTYENREMTKDEFNTVNDCLASVLKLTAKYKL